jgi:hypothetical protein
VTGTDLTHYKERWAAQAAERATHEKVRGASMLSTRSGQLMLGEQAMPGNQLAVIVVDAYPINTYYGERFDESRPMPPICYAAARPGAALGPHPSMQADPYFRWQHAQCEGCPLNEWGSAAQGRGKACQNRRQLMLIPAGHYVPRRGSRDMDLDLITDPRQLATADAVGLRLPVTSVENWAVYVNLLATQERRPPEGAITRIYVEPHPKFQYMVKFELIELVPDDLIQTVIARAQAVQSIPFGGFMPPPPEDQRGAQPQRRSLRG